jgi:hypothetical protein
VLRHEKKEFPEIHTKLFTTGKGTRSTRIKSSSVQRAAVIPCVAYKLTYFTISRGAAFEGLIKAHLALKRQTGIKEFRPSLPIPFSS